MRWCLFKNLINFLKEIYIIASGKCNRLTRIYLIKQLFNDFDYEIEIDKN